MKKSIAGNEHEQFVTAIKNKDYATARKLSKNSFIADRLVYRNVEAEIVGLEQTQKDAIWNYFHGNSKQCLNSIPKLKKVSDTEQL